MIEITRRQMLGALAATGTHLIAPAQAQGVGSNPTPKFGYEDVLQRARALAAAPFADGATRPPAPFDSLDFDSWRDIRFRDDHALFANLPGAFRLATFHRGFLFPRAVTVNTIRDGIAAPIPYSPALFDFGRVKVGDSLDINTGFAGFRMNFPVNDPHVYDEAISFLGASYFRFLGRDQQYGLSARALCVEAGTGKETFPFFREFWIETPAAGSNRAVIYALLDGEAATGAYRFDLTVGQESTLDVKATIFPRRAGVKFGLAPLTSMYLTGENDRRVRDGFRDELHDSDGLLVHNGAQEWLWRPLGNPPRERMSYFLDHNTRGFGLLQRDRTFESYQDLDLAYQKRPSYFVEPVGDWGDGSVELIELPTLDETNDNIVASWTPATAPEPGKAFAFAYRITAGLDMPRLAPNGRVVHTFEAPAHALGSAEPADPNAKRFMVDFAGGDLAYYVSDPAQVEAVATTSKGRVLRANVIANPHIDGLRAFFDVAVKPGDTTDLRLFLRAAGRTLTETWTLPWSAPSAT
ncbi:glucan biosynthesis protein [Methylocystis echinoides]|uniref:Glucans biosynthesis protein D n=1 Tax=Methylocystis echinoides TaxID=29468 RepID=A0A9W6LQX6_9HYPH|nr:glucan biosynthesis protein [Methylocystis echinoides]GLI91928.1 putative glucans biosynthesis protein D [Methylocystis echinoides]